MPYIPLPEPQIIKTEDGTIYLFFGEKFGWFDKDGFFNFNNLLKRSESLSSLSDSLQYSDSSCTIQDVRFIPVDPDIADKFRQHFAEIKEKYGDRFILVDPNPPQVIAPNSIEDKFRQHFAEIKEKYGDRFILVDNPSQVIAPKSIEPLKNINNHQST